MRILHCIPTMGGGGAERQVAYLLPLLAERGWEVHLAYLHDGPNRGLLGGAKVKQFQPVRHNQRDPRTAIELFRYIRRLRPDIVQTWLLYMDVIAGASCRMLHIPWVMAERSTGPLPQWGMCRNLSRRMVTSRASAIVSNSPTGDAYWSRTVGAKVKCYVIPNSLPLDRFTSVGAPTAEGILSPGQKVVLYVGRLEVEKNPETLVAVFQRLLSARRDVAVVLCGDGTHLPAVRDALEQGPHADRTHILGYTPDVWSWIRRADVVLNPSHVEGHPNTVLEAVGLGAPLVVSDIPSHRGILTESSALFAPANDVDVWVEKILSVLDHPEEARRRAEQARQSVSHFTPDAMADAYDRVYREVLNLPSK